jgi:hypothetical protein
MNKKVWLMLGMGALFISLEAPGGLENSHFESWVKNVLLDAADKATGENGTYGDRAVNNKHNMKLVLSVLSAMHTRVAAMEGNQIQQDIRMKDQADEIVKWREVAAMQKRLLLAKVDE